MKRRGIPFLLVLLVVVFGVSVQAHAMVYTFRNDAAVEHVDPLSMAEDAAAYYGLSNYSGYPAFGTVANKGFVWLYEDTTSGDISLGLIFNTEGAGGEGSVAMSFSGMPATAFWEVQDDGPHSDTYEGMTSAQWHWWWKTDGGMIGGLNGSWDITLTLRDSMGIDQWFFLDGDPLSPNRYLLDMEKPLVISAGTNVPVPEPPAMLFLASALGVLQWVRRRGRGVEV